MKNIVYTPKGLWKFYHSEKLGICFYPPENTTPLILFDKGAADFDVTCDADGTLYLMCQDDKNNFYMFYHDRQKWSKQCVLESKSAFSYPKNFRIISINGWVNAFYTIRHGKEYLLIHHILNNQGTPYVLETLPGSTLFDIARDSKDNIYCVYEKQGMQIGYKTFSWSGKTWQSYRTLATLPQPISHIGIVINRNDMLCAVCTCRKKADYAVYFATENGTQEIMDAITHNPCPVLLLHDETYDILFRVGGRLMQCTCKNPNIGFTKPSYYFPGSFSPHDIFKISATRSLRQKGIFGSFVYGSEWRPDKFEAALIQDKIDAFDFSYPTAITEIPEEIETYAKESTPFTPTLHYKLGGEHPEKPASDDTAVLQNRIKELEQKIKELEQKT